MDLGLTDEREMLRNVAREFLDKECPESLVRDMELDPRGYSPELWKKMAALGWHGLPLAEQFGGAGFGMQDLVVLLEEFGRALVPGPFFSTVVHVASALELGGSESQMREYLPQIAAGELIGSFAYVETSGRCTPEAVTLAAAQDGGGYVLNGEKLFVENAAVAGLFVVVARSGGQGREGLSLFLVDPRSAGITIRPLATLASDKECQVEFRDVRVPAAGLLGREGQGWPIVEQVHARAAVAECAYLAGLAAQDMDITVDYIKNRVQFGKPIGSFQALQHKAADMAVDVDGCRLITYRAAWTLDVGDPDAVYFASVAKGFVSDASQRVVGHGQQLHGGIGFTKEYKIQLFFRRQKAAELKWGDGDHHRASVAALLGI